jgi:molybdate transport system substrate-binding protein
MQTTSSPLRGISSMATKALLAKLCAEYATRASQSVEIESVGGVDAAKRVQAGEAMDVVLLASDAIERLIASGHVQPGSRVDWVQSPVALAVPLGATAPDISTPDALKLALLAAPSISYSTGPSGNYLAKLFEQWGIAELMKTKLIVPPPGQPVGSLVAGGQVALGFQQLSEMLGVPGITVVGNLPEGAAFITTFSAGIPVGLSPERVNAVQTFLDFLNFSDTAAMKLAQGMTPLA